LNLHLLSILGHNRVQLGLEFPPKKYSLIPRSAFSTLPVFVLFFYFYFEKKNESLGNNPELSYDIHQGIWNSMPTSNVYTACWSPVIQNSRSLLHRLKKPWHQRKWCSVSMELKFNLCKNRRLFSISTMQMA
jgi:hypothetical protein